MEKFLIINPFGIGDVLFTTSIVRALKQRYPGCAISYWCNERIKELFGGDARIDKIFALSRGDIKKIYKLSRLKGVLALIRLVRDIRRERFDVAFDFSLDARYNLLSKIAGIKRRIGFNYRNRGRFLTDKIDLEGYSGRHVVEYYNGLLKFIGIEPENKPPELIITEEKRAGAKKTLYGSGVRPSGPVVGIAMGGGASWGRDAIYKQWPPERFGSLAERLIKELGASIVLLGSIDEKPLADKIASLPSAARNDGGRLIDLTGKLSLGEVAAVIKELKLLICNDGGPLHMAAALGVDTVSIFGPVNEKIYGPYPPGKKHTVIKKDLQCRPCYKNFHFKGCLNDRHCLEDITVDEVFEKTKALLCAAI